jgi:hypothetical protein
MFRCAKTIDNRTNAQVPELPVVSHLSVEHHSPANIVTIN